MQAAYSGLYPQHPQSYPQGEGRNSGPDTGLSTVFPAKISRHSGKIYRNPGSFDGKICNCERIMKQLCSPVAAVDRVENPGGWGITLWMLWITPVDNGEIRQNGPKNKKLERLLKRLFKYFKNTQNKKRAIKRQRMSSTPLFPLLKNELYLLLYINLAFPSKYQ